MRIMDRNPWCLYPAYSIGSASPNASNELTNGAFPPISGAIGGKIRETAHMSPHACHGIRIGPEHTEPADTSAFAHAHPTCVRS